MCCPHGNLSVLCCPTMFRPRTLVLWVALLAGCSPPEIETPPPAAPPGEDALQALVDETLESNLYNRRLNTTDHAAWQVLHGALAYGQRFEVEHEGRLVPAVDYLLKGGRLAGWNLRAHDDSDRADGGLEVILEGGTVKGQGHSDQWLAVLSQCDLERNHPLMVDGRQHVIDDLVRRAQWEVEADREASWTLIGLSRYLPIDATWQNRHGREWSLERLVAAEADHYLGQGACGGSHRLIGMSMALNRYRAAKGGGAHAPMFLADGWRTADERIREAIAKAHEYQADSGEFSMAYFDRPHFFPNVKERLAASGHTLEFLALALDDAELREAWVERGVVFLCGYLADLAEDDIECGGLYHALHGLAVFRQRRFGEKQYPR